MGSLNIVKRLNKVSTQANINVGSLNLFFKKSE